DQELTAHEREPCAEPDAGHGLPRGAEVIVAFSKVLGEVDVGSDLQAPRLGTMEENLALGSTTKKDDPGKRGVRYLRLFVGVGERIDRARTAVDHRKRGTEFHCIVAMAYSDPTMLGGWCVVAGAREVDHQRLGFLRRDVGSLACDHDQLEGNLGGTYR